jgi:hypothetical protein
MQRQNGGPSNNLKNNGFKSAQRNGNLVKAGHSISSFISDSNSGKN